MIAPPTTTDANRDALFIVAPPALVICDDSHAGNLTWKKASRKVLVQTCADGKMMVRKNGKRSKEMPT
jgi:hypothetical protein